MAALRIVVANAPHIYREAIVAVVCELRPTSAVLSTDPAELDAAVLRHTPHLVICSRLTPAVQERAPAWVLLYPGGRDEHVFSLAGDRTTVAGLAFDHLARFLERVDHLARRPTGAAGTQGGPPRGLRRGASRESA
jgi:hypothetical protein